MLQLYKKNQGGNEHSDIVEIKGVIKALAVGPQQGRQRKKHGEMKGSPRAAQSRVLPGGSHLHPSQLGVGPRGRFLSWVDIFENVFHRT